MRSVSELVQSIRGRRQVCSYSLLHPASAVDRVALRSHAREAIEGSLLIRACADGWPSPLDSLFSGFWPYIEGFEKAIDRQVSRMPIKPLVQRFGRERIRDFFGEARLSLRKMRSEEGSHANLWLHAAKELGVSIRPGKELVLREVQELLDNARTDDPVSFFCWLAGTEYIAEELARFLCSAPAFLSRFKRGRWDWGDAHLAEHEGPSHLEIDEDLAQAYHPSPDPAIAGSDIMIAIHRCIDLFGAAAREVAGLRGAEYSGDGVLVPVIEW